MAWTKVAKPSGTSYTQVTFAGSRNYDDSAITYDSSSTLYDSANALQWTKVLHDVRRQIILGMATGLIMPPTYSTDHEPKDYWTRIAKPS